MDNIGRLLYLDYVTDKVDGRGYNMIMCRAIVSLRSRKVRLLFRHHKHIGKWDAKPQPEIDFSELKKVYNEIAGVDCNQFEKIVYCVTKIIQDRYTGRWFNGNIRVSNGARVLTTIESGNLKQLFDFEPGEEDTEKNIDAPYHITEQDLKYMVKAAVSRLLNEEYVGLDYNACKAEAEKYTRKEDFRNNSYKAYRIALQNGWMKDFDWLQRKIQKWGPKETEQEAKKYSTLKDFFTNSPNAYRRAVRSGWLKDYTWLKGLRGLCLWDETTCYEEAKKYSTLKDFYNNNKSCYEISRRNGWLKDYTWLKSRRSSGGK